jgi:hypothetical protein
MRFAAYRSRRAILPGRSDRAYEIHRHFQIGPYDVRVPDYFTVEGTLYEVESIGPVDDPGFHFECWDLSADGAGLVGTIVVPADDGPDSVSIDLLRRVRLDVLLHWMALVPETRTHLRSPPD